jgi:CDP-diacylglycerol--glycerol-3-phosphate 3-phosphatidyltransferase
MARVPPEARITSYLPNALSLSRIVFGLALFLLLPKQEVMTTAISLGIVALSSITDYFDGRIARRTKSVSVIGKWLDPISDFTFFLFVYLSFYRIGLMPLLLLLLFLARELAMYAVIRPLYMIRKLDPGAKAAGKAKTVLQIVGSVTLVAALLLSQLGLLPGRLLLRVAPWLLVCLVAASLASLIWYVLPLSRSAEDP